MIYGLFLGLVWATIAANVGVCVWAIITNDPRMFAASGCIAALLGFQVRRELDRRQGR